MAGEPYYFSPEDPNSDPVDLSAIQIVPPEPATFVVPDSWTQDQPVQPGSDWAQPIPQDSAAFTPPPDPGSEFAQEAPMDTGALATLLPEEAPPEGMIPAGAIGVKGSETIEEGVPQTEGQASAQAGLMGVGEKIDAEALAQKKRSLALRQDLSTLGREADLTRQQYAKDMAVWENKRAAAMGEASKRIQDSDAELSNFRFNDFFSSRGAASGIAAMLGMAAAGFLQGWSNGKVNMMPMFENMMDRDFQRQKAEYDRLRSRGQDARNAYATIARNFDSEAERKAAFTRAMTNNILGEMQRLEQSGRVRDQEGWTRLGFELQKANLGQENLLAKQTQDKRTTRVQFKFGPASSMGPGTGEPVHLKGSDAQVRKYYDALRQDKIPEAMANLDNIANVLQDPDIQKFYGMVGNQFWQSNPKMAGMAAKLLGPEKAARYTAAQQALQSLRNDYLFGKGGKNLTGEEKTLLYAAVSGAGDYNGALNGIKMIANKVVENDRYAQGYLQTQNARDIAAWSRDQGLLQQSPGIKTPAWMGSVSTQPPPAPGGTPAKTGAQPPAAKPQPGAPASPAAPAAKNPRIDLVVNSASSPADIIKAFPNDPATRAEALKRFLAKGKK